MPNAYKMTKNYTAKRHYKWWGGKDL